MSDKPEKVTAKYGQKVRGVTPLPSPDPEADGEELSPAEDHRPFSTIVLARRQQQIMLEVVKKTGNRHALGYSYLASCEYDPSEGIFLGFTGHNVHIAGSNLVDLWRYLIVHKASSIIEGYSDAESGLVIDSITVNLAGEEDEKKSRQ